MTSRELVNQLYLRLGKPWGSPKDWRLTGDHINEYIEALEPYSGDDLERLYKEALKECKSMPSIAGLFELIRGMNLTASSRRPADPGFPMGDCALCDGQGFIRVIYQQERVKNQSGYYWRERQRTMVPGDDTGKADAARERFAGDDFMVTDGIALCRCAAGEGRCKQYAQIPRLRPDRDTIGPPAAQGSRG